MIEYKQLIVNQQDTPITGSNLCVFIDTNFTVELFLKLLKIESKFIFVNTNKLYFEQDIELERQQIVDYLNKGTKVSLEHYSQYDLINPDYVLNGMNESDSTIDNLFQKIEQMYLIENMKRFFVTEYYIKENPYITNLTNLIFNNINVNQIAITTNQENHFKIIEKLDENDKLIAKASVDNNNQILLVPDDFRFKVTPTLVLLNDHDYKFAVNQLFNKKYILGFKDSLKDSQYFKSLCEQYQIKTVDNTISAIISIVEKYGHLIISEVEDEQLVIRYQFTRNNEKYKRLVLVYKHCLKHNIDFPENLKLIMDK